MAGEKLGGLFVINYQIPHTSSLPLRGLFRMLLELKPYSMQRLELVKEIVKKTGSEKHSVETILKTFMRSVEEHLIKGEHISLSGFGSFGVKKRAAKMGRNISKNIPLKIPAYFSPVFKPSKRFIRKVKNH